MVLRFPIRPVLVAAAGLCVSACGGVEGDGARFENLARKVAEVPISLDRPGEAPARRSAAEIGLRPAQPLRVQVLDPHDLWDARDGLAPAVVKAAAPVVADAVTREATRRTVDLRPADMPTRPHGARLIQLGAFSSRQGAEAAWTQLKSGSAGRTLAGLTPRYETAVVGGRELVRLKVAAPSDAAPAICSAARIDAPWCRRGA